MAPSSYPSLLSYSKIVINNKSKQCHHTQIVHSWITKVESLKLQVAEALLLQIVCNVLVPLTMTQSLNFWPHNLMHWSELYLLFKAYLSSQENCICPESQIPICSGQFHTPYNLRFGTKTQHFTFLWTGKYQIHSKPHFIVSPLITEIVGVFLSTGLMSLFATMCRRTKMSFSIT